MGCSSDKYSLPQEKEEDDDMESILKKQVDNPKNRRFTVLQENVLKNKVKKTISDNKNKIVVDISALFYTEEELNDEYQYDEGESISSRNIEDNISGADIFKKITNEIMNNQIKENKTKKNMKRNSLEEEMNLIQNNNTIKEENNLYQNNNCSDNEKNSFYGEM